ncbi:MAG: class II aldolase/adducin family protein [Eubacteriales bacterium]|nr:class II aldolase/adducin family protein [Eubacteriales bacterium]MDD3196802.1 class II aldolase/adducin family protein [Eubacteriales bacterium]MDD3503061.1 class II aldolase/adducin family protein [Eubacteriales bacterium]MDD4682528.1 class II aldolase/adducin family protein [Eubacteriales bacterium]
MNFELLHPADQLVMIMDRIYNYGMTTTSGGNLSIMDEQGDLWITPGGVDKGSLTRDDMVCVKNDGTIIGKHKPSSELPFHQSVYRRRSDIKSVLHAHPSALVAFSIVRRLPDVRLIPNVNLICGKIAMAPYGLPGSDDLGEKIAKKFDEGYSTVLLENHGVVIGSKSLFDAFMAFETLEFSARIELHAIALGNVRTLDDRLINISRMKNTPEMPTFKSQGHTSEEKAARRDMIKLIHRSYEQSLFTSTQGTYSVRLSDNSFLITPYGMDRKYLAAEDLVLVKDGAHEEGKTPSRSALLHDKIYNRNEEINSILIAHPPYTMAFAVTDEPFDSRTIPESYIMLRNIEKIPFGASFMQPDMTADIISHKTPVILCENDCVIVTGQNLLNAFDRLEVAEYSAHAIIASKRLGSIVQISDQEVADIHVAFNLAE